MSNRYFADNWIYISGSRVLAPGLFHINSLGRTTKAVVKIKGKTKE